MRGAEIKEICVVDIEGVSVDCLAGLIVLVVEVECRENKIGLSFDVEADRSSIAGCRFAAGIGTASHCECGTLRERRVDRSSVLCFAGGEDASRESEGGTR